MSPYSGQFYLYAARNPKLIPKDNDNVSNIVKEILDYWRARLREDNRENIPEEYIKSGGASSVEHIKQLVQFVKVYTERIPKPKPKPKSKPNPKPNTTKAVDTEGRDLTITLCSFLATCKVNSHSNSNPNPESNLTLTLT